MWFEFFEDVIHSESFRLKYIQLVLRSYLAFSSLKSVLGRPLLSFLLKTNLTSVFGASVLLLIVSFMIICMKAAGAL